MKTKLLIPWSGGLDSTYLVARALEHTHMEVHTNYTFVENNGYKAECERRALNQLMEQFGNVYRDWFHHDGTLIELPEVESHGASYQPFFWMMSMIPVASTLLEDDTDLRVQIGYIKGDTVLPYMDKVDQSWKTIWDMVIPDHPAPILETPLRHMTKSDVLRNIKRLEEHRNIKLSDTIWTCEYPEAFATAETNGFRRCGICDPCMNDVRFTSTGK